MAGRGRGNVYRDLVDGNDLVRELEDIEAISQQISQHAEILYQTWKNNNNGSSRSSNGSLAKVESNGRGGVTSAASVGGMTSSPRGSQGFGQGLSASQNWPRLQSSGYRASYNSSPHFSASTSPITSSSASSSSSNSSARSSEQRALELLASQPVSPSDDDSASSLGSGRNRDMKALVNSFVSTDRAKQAARQTISQHLRMSPLKSPHMLSSIDNKSANNSDDPMKPFEPLNIHRQMTPIFGNRQRQRATDVGQLETSKPADSPRPSKLISIPVQHINMTSDTDSNSDSNNRMSASRGDGSSLPSRPLTSTRPVRLVGQPDPELMHHAERMRQRFEEAKQRIHRIHQRAIHPLSTLSTPQTSSFPSLLFPGPLFESGGFGRPRPRSTPEQLPHPELTPLQKEHVSILREKGVSVPIGPAEVAQSMVETANDAKAVTQNAVASDVRPSSVAERVLMFERCPPIFSTEQPVWTASIGQHQPTSNFAASLRASDQSKPQTKPLSAREANNNVVQPQVKVREIPIVTVSPFSASTLATSSSTPTLKPKPVLASKTRASSLISPKSKPVKALPPVPQFHYPHGVPLLPQSVEARLRQIGEEARKAASSKNMQLSKEQVGTLLKKCGYPMYWKGPVVHALNGSAGSAVSVSGLSSLFRQLLMKHHDECSQFMALLTTLSPSSSLSTPRVHSRRYLLPDDFVPLVQDVVDTHPGLGFLKEATEFHSRYVHTVIARIYYCVNRSWSGRISLTELRKSNLLSAIRVLEDEDDINRVTAFFSYEHFYVIYCKFWELDKDHDLFIDKEDLARHNDHALSSRLIDRIFSGCVTRGAAQKEGKMSYTEFVWFILAEEDKRHPTAIEYWFRCMDVDGDGYLSMFELEYFYEEQLQRMEQLGIETLPFEDCLCQMLDMISPMDRTRIALSDLKRCRMTPIFFDTFFNLEKYLDHEQRDPFASSRDFDDEGNEMSDWDRFAAEEYEILVAEDGQEEMYDESQDGTEGMHLDELHSKDEAEPIYDEPIIEE